MVLTRFSLLSLGFSSELDLDVRKFFKGPKMFVENFGDNLKFKMDSAPWMKSGCG
jgi:hypothetical protein